MARVDIIYKDLSGIYLDDVWMPVEKIDVSRQDSEPEFVYEFGGDRHLIRPSETEWTVRVTFNDGGVKGHMTIQNPETHFWNNQQDYTIQRHQYIIEEWP